MKPRKLLYTVGTSLQPGEAREHVGTIDGARIKAVRHARQAFPASRRSGQGPTITIKDATTQNVIEEFRL